MGGSKINMFRNKIYMCVKGRIHITKNNRTLEKPACQCAIWS